MSVLTVLLLVASIGLVVYFVRQGQAGGQSGGQSGGQVGGPTGEEAGGLPSSTLGAGSMLSTVPTQAQIEALVKEAIALQEDYWSPSEGEKEELLSVPLEELEDEEKLRLLQLECIDAAIDGVERGQAPPEFPEGEARERVLALREALLREGSPYRPASGLMLWLGHDPSQDEARAPDFVGALSNASLTHLGSLEVVRFDERLRATELALLPLLSLRRVSVAAPATFSFAVIEHLDGRPDELVLLPLLYGLTHRSPEQRLRAGRMTQFRLLLPGPGAPSGAGLGQQDFSVITETGQHLFGVGALEEAELPLSPEHPDFLLRCEQREIDPEEFRAVHREMLEEIRGRK